MIEIYNNETNALIGEISEAELKFLVDACEEESRTDQDYYITVDFIGTLGDDGAPENLLKVLRTAVGEADDVEVRWQRT